MTSSTFSSGDGPAATSGNGAIVDRVVDALRTALGDDTLAADDDFFEAGGDSVAAVHALELLEQATGVQLPVAVFFTHSSASELAKIIAEQGETAA